MTFTSHLGVCHHGEWKYIKLDDHQTIFGAIYKIATEMKFRGFINEYDAMKIYNACAYKLTDADIYLDNALMKQPGFLEDWGYFIGVTMTKSDFC